MAARRTPPRPLLSSVTIDGAALTLTYDEALDTDSVPAATDFTVQSGGSPVSLATVSPVTVGGSTVTLTLAAAVTALDTVTLSYVPGTNPIQDAAGNDAAALTNQAVVNSTADTTAPLLSSATVNGATVTLTYDEALDTASVPAGTDFTVQSSGSPVSLASSDPVAVSGSTVTLTLAAAVTALDTVTLSYTPGTNPIQDAAGNDAGALTNQAVTNSTADTTAPLLSSATVNGATVTLTYDEALDTASVPAATDFSVQSGGSPVSLASSDPVAVSGSTVDADPGRRGHGAGHGDAVLHARHEPDTGRRGQRRRGADEPGGDEQHGRTPPRPSCSPSRSTAPR